MNGAKKELSYANAYWSGAVSGALSLATVMGVYHAYRVGPGWYFAFWLSLFLLSMYHHLKAGKVYVEGDDK